MSGSPLTNPTVAVALSTTTTASEAAVEDGRRAKKTVRRRQKRILSCETCQRLKCRCEYDPALEKCRRCQTLRLPCSLNTGKPSAVPGSTHNQESLSLSSIEERLSSHDTALTEIKSLLGQLVSNLPSSPGSRQHHDRVSNLSSPNSHVSQSQSISSDDDLEDISNPADQGLGAAPAVVIREIGRQLVGGHRRLLQNIKLDLVELNIGLREDVAQELFSIFINSRPGFVIAYDTNNPESLQLLRTEAPFLFSVCCLIAMRYWREKHKHAAMFRSAYEHVRSALGQVVLASPLPIGDINAVEILCSFSSAPSMNGVEYIDSWLLSGFCVQHAMLSISFSRIVNNVKSGTYTVTDYREIKLWAQICLNHLQWAATTGRPPSITTPYLNQCYILINMDQATVQDGHIVADIHLYSSLHRTLDTRLRSERKLFEEEFLPWKQKWKHLFSQPNKALLELSYYAAHLILVVRCIDESVDSVHQDVLDALSMDSPNYLHSISTRNILSNTAHASPHSSRMGSNTRTRDDSDYRKACEALACKYALLMLQTSIGLSSKLAFEMPEYLKLCLAYSAFVITNYDPGPEISPEVIYNSLKTLESESRSHPCFYPNPLTATIIARQKLDRKYWGGTENVAATAGSLPINHIHLANAGPPVYTDQMPSALPIIDAQSVDPTGIWRSNDGDQTLSLDLDSLFPSMENFFAGEFQLPDLEPNLF